MQSSASTSDYQKHAEHIRENIIRMLLSAGTGHSAGPLGMTDVFTVLYSTVLQHDPNHPTWKDRDRLVLSCGHICPVLYATLSEFGYFSEEELLTLRQFGSRLQGHPSRIDLPGIEVTSGPLGQGISQAVGMALALQADGSNARVYCVMSDGEHNEGQVWEALMFSAKMNLTNLTIIIDRNDIQIDGYTHSIMPLEPLREKYESFGWHVSDINGHDYSEILEGFEMAQSIVEKPVVLIMHTVPGKGVDFMENKFQWHGRTPDEAQAYQAILELRTLGGKISHE